MAVWQSPRAYVGRLRRQLNQSLNIESLAKGLGMSPSAFHHHFKAITGMSPCRSRSSFACKRSAACCSAKTSPAAPSATELATKEPSLFSRAYKRHFGDSPVRDVERLRTMTSAD